MDFFKFIKCGLLIIFSVKQLSLCVFHSAEDEGPESDDEEEEDDNDVSLSLAQLDIVKYLMTSDRYVLI